MHWLVTGLFIIFPVLTSETRGTRSSSTATIIRLYYQLVNASLIFSYNLLF